MRGSVRAPAHGRPATGCRHHRHFSARWPSPRPAIAEQRRGVGAADGRGRQCFQHVMDFGGMACNCCCNSGGSPAGCPKPVGCSLILGVFVFLPRPHRLQQPPCHWLIGHGQQPQQTPDFGSGGQQFVQRFGQGVFEITQLIGSHRPLEQCRQPCQGLVLLKVRQDVPQGRASLFPARGQFGQAPSAAGRNGWRPTSVGRKPSSSATPPNTMRLRPGCPRKYSAASPGGNGPNGTAWWGNPAKAASGWRQVMSRRERLPGRPT